MRQGLAALALVCALGHGACSSDEPGASPADASTDTTSDVATNDAEPGVSLDLCTGAVADLATATVIPEAFADSVLGDCRVSYMFALGPADGTAFLDRLRNWTAAFFGCVDGGVTGYGPADTGKKPTLTQADVDVISEHYLAQVTAFFDLSSSDLALVSSELSKLAAKAVNAPGTAHSLSLCVDADAGSDASFDAADAEEPIDAAGAESGD